MSMHDFFAFLGKFFLRAGKVLGKLITDQQVDAATALIAEAAGRFTEKTVRREWVTNQLMTRFHLSESVALWLLQTAFIEIKAKEAELIGAAGDKVKTLNDDPSPAH